MAIPPILEDTLRRYGLSSLLNWATEAIVNSWSADQIVLEMYKRPEFKTRFPAIFELQAGNKPAISVEEYLSYEKTAASLAAMWGTELSKDEVDNLISNLVSPVELQARFDLGAEAVYESDDETISELARMSGADISDGRLIKFFMDPKKELGALQSEFRQAQISGVALRTGWGRLTQEQAQRLRETGMDQQSAGTAFSTLAAMGEVFSPFSSTESLITQERQIEFLAGDVEAAREIEARVAKRKAEFEGSGGFAAGQQGFATGTAE
jgi:hypothetical protein